MPGVHLTLWNLTVKLDPSSDQEFRMFLDGGSMEVHGGSLTTNTTGRGWRLETSMDGEPALSIEGANISYVGGGGHSGFSLRAGTRHTLNNVTVSHAVRGASGAEAIVRVNAPTITRFWVRNSTFTDTGRVALINALAPGAASVFRDNVVEDFDPSGGVGVLYAVDTDIVNNSIQAGDSLAIVAAGGGPGWPQKNTYKVSSNTIETTFYALYTPFSQGYDIVGNHISKGRVALDGEGHYFAFNNLSDVDARVTAGHVIWSAPNSTVRHNTLWNASVTNDSGIVARHYGNTSITGNALHLRCFGDNCMGIEVINVQEEQRPTHPGFPTVEVSWNTVTWLEIAPGTNAHPLDHEFSRRLYVHNNTVHVDPAGLAPGERVTELLMGGGAVDSVFENNTATGPTDYCIYHFIYERAGNLFQNNVCRETHYASISQTGNNTYRHNVFENISMSGTWICPNAPCAGADTNTTNTSDNVWYNNTYRFREGDNLTLMHPANAYNNTFLGHGADRWREGFRGASHPVHDGWLFFANTTIDRLEFSNRTDGSRWVRMWAHGREYWDRNPDFGASDAASLTVTASIDGRGSTDGRTVLWQLAPRGNTSLNLTASGMATLVLSSFLPNQLYNVTFCRASEGQTEHVKATTDREGYATVAFDLGPALNRYHITITPLPLPVDTTPPARVTDLRVPETGSDFAVLQWMAPGDDDDEGVATAYEIRYSAEGPLDDGNFESGTPVNPPSPGVPGTVEEVAVLGLKADTEYWFALRTADEVPNWSLVSNSPSGCTSPAVDTTPPLVEFLSPLEGQVVSDPVEVSLEATDDRGIAEVVLWVDDVEVVRLSDPPYGWTWSVQGLEAGPHRLKASAHDRAGNEGSVAVTVHVRSPGDPKSPRIEAVWYMPSNAQVDVVFTQPMNRTSTSEALVLDPPVGYALVWSSDRHLVVKLQKALSEGQSYRLMIGVDALDLEGRPLTEALEFGFEAPGSPAGSPLHLPWWAWASGLLAVGGLLALVQYRRRGNRVPQETSNEGGVTDSSIPRPGERRR